ncbi:MAG: prepilin-type N-terminal cleavage/methylation domain-containing protein [Verrucomicrobia bacterium]|nr:MAG: prepilin-type N-terminal cleavage/methylation domain-containing protein [Verrucomicrobiota bacterium]
MIMKPAATQRAFTLVEMLMVIAIIGILTAVSLPVLRNLRGGDVLLSGSRQMLDDIARARQLAISQRTTVYMVFCPDSFWSNPGYNGWANPGWSALNATETNKAGRLYDKQLNGYNFVTLRSVGDQPGRSQVRYLSSWRALPEGAIIAPFKFLARTYSTRVFDPPLPATPALQYWDVKGFEVTNNIPFPSETATASGPPYVPVPYIAFNHLGQLVSGEDEYIPLAKGSLSYAVNKDKLPQQAVPTFHENPAGNSTNAFMLVHIDWLTGRGSIERQEIK